MARADQGSHRNFPGQLCRTLCPTSNSTFSGAHVPVFGGVQEPLPEPTPAELAAEAQQEATVFSQAADVDRLLSMLRTLDPAKDNLADNEEIQELYRSCMTLRPKVVKLIDKYSQKRGMLSLCIK